MENCGNRNGIDNREDTQDLLATKPKISRRKQLMRAQEGPREPTTQAQTKLLMACCSRVDADARRAPRRLLENLAIEPREAEQRGVSKPAPQPTMRPYARTLKHSPQGNLRSGEPESTAEHPTVSRVDVAVPAVGKCAHEGPGKPNDPD